MLTKGAIGNLVNRYRAVLTKCNLMNTFGSLAVAAMLVMGGAGEAEAARHYALGNTTPDAAISSLPDGKDRVLGGWRNTASITAPVENKFTIASGKYNLVVGGSYLSDANGEVSVKSTEVTIKGGDIYQVAGGNGGTDNKKLLYTGENVTSKLNIEGGNFGKTSVSGNCPELLVIGGNLLKDGKKGKNLGASGSMESTEITISGGTFNSAIIGGSASIQYYDWTGADLSASAERVGLVNTVKKATINIKGGTFSNAHPIVGGGFAYGWDASSSVDEVVMNISDGATVDADIYTGGMVGNVTVDRDDKTTVRTVAEVGKATINVTNAEVKNIYGTNVHMTQPGGNNTPWKYTAVTDSASNIYAAVKTSLTMTNSTANEVFIPGNESSVALRSEDAGKVSIKNLIVQNADKITISADGLTNDKLSGDVTQLTGIISADKIVYLDASEVESNELFADKEVVMEAGAVTGEVTAIFDKNGKLAKQTEKSNETNVAMADLPTINLMLTRVEMNDLRKRMGDIRLLEGNTGVWARWDGGKMKGDSGLTNDFHKIQLGADTTTGIDNLRLGAAFSYTNSDMDFAKANAESDTLSFAGYGVWTANNGIFADVIARLAFVDTEVQTDKVKGDLNNLALSLSGEFGWRFDFCDKFFVEPQVELTYTYVNSDDFSSNGVKFDFDDSDSLIGRAGLATGWKLPNDLGDLYARASVVQEFMGDGKLTTSLGKTIRTIETDGNDTWLEYGIGANVKINNNAYIFADIERTAGADIDEEWRGTVGIRYSF